MIATIQHAANYARSLIEASLDPLVTINTKGKITDFNRATIDITGISKQALVGTDFFHYFTNSKKANQLYQEVFDKGSVANFPLTLKHVSGRLTEVLLNGSVYKDELGSVLGVVLVARDVTEQNRISNELNASKIIAESAMELAELAKIKAEAATRIAEDSVKAKQQFLSNMSHEIRTPMNAIIGFTKFLQKTELSHKQLEYLKAIKVSGDSLVVLINDILDLAKVDAGKMQFEQIPFNMQLSITELLQTLTPKIQEKNLEFGFNFDNKIPNVLMGDSVRLNQIILNLISNAIKFTSAGSVSLDTIVQFQNAHKVTIQFIVKDTGIGIAADKIEKIFDNFQQATSGTSRIYGGTGLGLAIVKQLVEGQGGVCSVVSEEHVGSTFSFVLDFLKTNNKIETEVDINPLIASANNIKVLVVEDILLNQLLMKTLLDDFGFQFDIAGNGRVALEKMHDAKFDVILMDLQMPEMNGYETTRFIRNNLKLNLPIIALTADVTAADLAKCKEVGMNDYLSKPVNDKLLYNKIISLVNKSTTVNDGIEIKANDFSKTKCIDLTYLLQKTKASPSLMIEMISLYLEQTPLLIELMQSSLKSNDWEGLQSSVHKIIPSFLIMGISSDFEKMAVRVKNYAHEMQQNINIKELILKIELVCLQACVELEEELSNLKSK